MLEGASVIGKSKAIFEKPKVEKFLHEQTATATGGSRWEARRNISSSRIISFEQRERTTGEEGSFCCCCCHGSSALLSLSHFLLNSNAMLLSAFCLFCYELK